MTTLLDRLLGRTGAHRRTYPAWLAMETRVAAMDAQDDLIADLVRQRDEQRRLAAAAGAQIADFEQRVMAAERRANRAERSATRLHADLANAQAISVPMYATETPTQELPITRVMSLQARGAA